MPKLEAGKRARLPDSAFAYIDSRGQRRLPINDEPHVRNALARFNQVAFESDEARERARLRLLKAAKRYGIVPVGFISGQFETERQAGEKRATDDGARLPSGELALVMTDIEGSTSLVQKLGDDYGELLDRVRETTRRMVGSRGGHEVDSRADEFFAVFEDTRSALASAVAIRLSMEEISQVSGHLVKMRIGIHAGRPTRRGSSYIGLPVHVTARLCTLAKGGQILVSSEIRLAVRGAGYRFTNLGPQQLAGLPEDLTVFSLRSQRGPQ
ncbi:MAG TPA: adenylate/guanylate cyclase domain-containing protein [Acidimicrobiia bacterium]|nr:adenylate/guanylate cyclase domain-containing protein [Acidimicrobiia bacterium]